MKLLSFGYRCLMLFARLVATKPTVDMHMAHIYHKRSDSVDQQAEPEAQRVVTPIDEQHTVCAPSFSLSTLLAEYAPQYHAAIQRRSFDGQHHCSTRCSPPQQGFANIWACGLRFL